ncbi:hypothetical protein [Wenxinia marina]|uniref:Uncharacterized protein n=1 Tax=Wenxinia marina DSM 24838 TaxID=1123501 RepID=A0A0D0QCT6_9RHOB|nr:hypothetical protein [Wenxinia marina]KIQ68773.1 hypothetical protein Wenmar_02500 [Wenxinia marina DSM 24838]GGL65282.1 hypothetical protein GCM10011392_19980 [Wenxinia marina]
MGVVEDLADALAKDTLEAADAIDDPNLVDEVSGVILAQSQTLQEAFMTAIRVRRSERAGRRFLDTRIAAARAGKAAPPPPTSDNPDV